MAELRRHPVSGEWVVICPEKALKTENEGERGCLYCPGNEDHTGPEVYRSNGGNVSNDPTWRVRVVAESPPLFHVEGDFSKKAAGLCDSMEAIGAHEVLLDSPVHQTEFESLEEGQVIAVLEALRSRARDLRMDPRLRQVLMFKVRAVDCGSHPRWHIVSTPFVPGSIKAELKGSAEYFSYKERCVFCDYIRQELKSGSRVICEEPTAIAISPYAARFPYEVWILPIRHSADYGAIEEGELLGFARILKKLTAALMKIQGSNGYVVGIHTAPFIKPKPGSWKTIALDYHWHFDVKPRLDVLNGLKEGGGFHLNPVPPEDAALILRNLC